MSDHEQTVHQVRDMELKSGHDEMRTVRAQDGRTTVTEIQVRDEFAGWGTLAVGYARRKKGDRRDADLGGALSLYRALESLLERHREVFAQRWPGFFAKESRQIREARAAVKYAHEKVDVAAGEIENAQRAQYQKRQLEQRIQTALELLEASPEAWLGGSNNVTAAAHVLRGGEAKEKNPSHERMAEAVRLLEGAVPFDLKQTNNQVWQALRVLRDDSDSESPRSLGMGEGPADLSTRDGSDLEERNAKALRLMEKIDPERADLKRVMAILRGESDGEE